MSNKEKFIVGFTCFLGGIVVGFAMSPIKKGISIGNNSGNTIHNKEDLKQFSEFFNEDDGQQ